MEEKDEPKSRFEGEMTRLMNVAISGITDLKAEVSELTREVKKTNQKVDVLSGQFSGVVSMVIEDNKRITKLEGEVAELQSNIH
jgi:peptidoglycan hydrolase CwlO-like protein